MLCLDPSTENLPQSVLTMTVLAFNAETQKAGSRCQKFSLGVYSSVARGGAGGLEPPTGL